VTFIVDEVQTGMSTGRMWCHEYWDLETPPDIVTFAKKFQVSGLFVNPEFMPKNLNTNFCGEGCFDLFRLHNLSTIMDVVVDKNLFVSSSNSSAYLYNCFENLSEYTNIFSNLRGRGNFMAFDLPDAKHRDSFIKFSRNKGVFLAGCGENTVRLRPSLTITPDKYDHLCEIMKSFKFSSEYKEIIKH
jgi:4-aminobutyrate aminotransferase/(S)-3-amino-2-methylpropionate transaminase